ncbi:MAG TPA: glycosyltransferase family 4 protein [Azospira sp.]|nr:glycosyltransferase family 4 protein [Azospira sp.]
MLITHPRVGKAATAGDGTLPRAIPRELAADLAAMSPAHLPGATRRPHICFVAPEAWPVFSANAEIAVVGGAEVQQSTLARLLAGAGYRVSMICFDYGQPERVMLHGVEVVRCHPRDAGVPVLRFLHPRLTGMWRAMRAVDADIYYQRSAAMLTAVVAAFCRWHGKRSIYAGASDSDFRPGRQEILYRRDRWLFERGLAAVDAVVVQNETQQRDCLAAYGRSATLIPSCYELPADADPGRGDYVLWVATLRPGKRPELFLELARRLPHRRFVMIGGAAADPGGAAYFAAIRRAALALPNVEFAGFLPLAEVEPRFDRARVVVNTSTFEGMPNVFLQAWARGVPTVAFIDVGARLRGRPLYRVVADAASAAADIERYFVDDLHRLRSALRCRHYFAVTHGSKAVLAHYRRLLDTPPAEPRR